MSNAAILRHAVFLTLGVLLFAFGASRMIAGPVEQVAKACKSRPVQVVGVDE